VAALIGLRGDTTYEAQAAMELEAVAAGMGSQVEPYPFLLADSPAPAMDGGPVATLRVIDWRPMLQALLADLRAGAAPAQMAARFHAGMVAAIAQAVGHIARDTGLRTVALSGGCFQNRLLLTQTVGALEGDGLEVLIHRQVPANDGGVALGQAAIGAWLKREI